jgi:hypothetical protein
VKNDHDFARIGRWRKPGNNFANKDAPIYRTIQSLPFYGLL